MKKRNGRLLGLLFATVMLLGLIPTAVFAEDAGADRAIMAGAGQLEGAQKDSVYFGEYWQSNETEKEPVKWRVLSNEDGSLFLLSNLNLDAKPYNTEYTDITWEDCTLRGWLNGDFFREAFNGPEGAAIAVTKVVNGDDKPEYETSGGNDTQDKLFALSVAEATDPAYGFSPVTGEDDPSRAAANTQHTVRMSGAGEADYWWLRSLVCEGWAASVDVFGCLNNNDYIVNSHNVAVRPAFKLNLNSVLFTSAAEDGKTGPAEGGAGTFFEIPAYSGNEWKATVLDGSRSGFTAETTGKSGNILTVSYGNAKTGANEYISVLLADAAGAYTHYGRVLGLDGAVNGADGTVKIDLTGIDLSGKTVYVFNEQYNGDKRTDFAGELRPVASAGKPDVSTKTDAPSLSSVLLSALGAAAVVLAIILSAARARAQSRRKR